MNTILIPHGNHRVQIKIDDIIHLKGVSNYCNLILGNAEIYLTSKTIKNWLKAFSSDQFIRVHKSHAVNKEFIKEISTSKKRIIMISGCEIPYRRGFNIDELINKDK